jgi:Ca-activated chloride channel family protein
MSARILPAIRRLLPIVLIALPVLGSLPVPGAHAQTPPLMTVNDVQRGQLLFHSTRHGKYAPAPLVATEVEIDINGIVARTMVKQYFVNPTQDWLEGRYVFPLPENSAVSEMKLVIGDRVIEAKIAERAAARKAYEAAKRQGRRAALVEQHRPNIFSNNVANIPPGGRIAVQLHYTQRLDYDRGKFSLRFPLVVAPRFDPAGSHIKMVKQPIVSNGDDMPENLRNALPEIRIPLKDPAKSPPGNPVTMTINLDAGMALSTIASDSHKVGIETLGDGRRRITLNRKAVAADRDFTLDWTPKLTTAPLVAAFRERIGDDVFVTALIMPPAPEQIGKNTRPRDVVFILDRSGSMGGISIRAARSALDAAIDRLAARDRFNLIRFSNDTDTLFDQAMPASDTNRLFAKLFLRDTTADGGTVMRPALHAALNGDAAEGRLKQVVFVTDGAVSNETELFRDIRQRLGNARLFTVGIGSAPNSYFMRKAAEAGRGAFVYIPDIKQVGTRMTTLFDKLERPALTDVVFAWQEGADGGATENPITAESFPAQIPDLYFGEPVLLVSRLPADALEGNANLSLGAGSWKTSLKLRDVRPAKGISTLWARAKVTALSDSLRDGAPPDVVKAGITKIGLTHSLVTRYTSLLATEQTVARPVETPLISGDVPLNLPHGWTFNTTMGKHLLKRSAAPPPAMKMRMRGSAAKTKADLATRPVILPAGATPFFVHLAIGLGLILLAGMVLMVTVPRPGRAV